MAESDGVSWSTPGFRLRWDVFLSFRGADTRDGFTGRLYNELERNGVRVFRDNDGMTQGDSLDPILFEAIEDSAASITIISPNYASSRWCLEELTRICATRRLILPVFYRVDPPDVRHQTGLFGDHFRNHEMKFEEEMVEKWRKAMEKVGAIPGLVFHNNSEEPQLIRSLVKRILKEMSNTPVVVVPYTVGLDSRVEELIRFLDVKCKGNQVLGFHGAGGIGKTTLAKALFDKLLSHFEHHSFIPNVRETCAKQNGLLSLQNKLIADLSPGRLPPVNDDNAGKMAIKGILSEKRVLVVLDDIDSVGQLNALAGSREWFHEGSRFVICTRNRDALLTNLVDEIYEVNELDSSDSLKLFCYHALRREKPTETFLNLPQQIVSLTGGLPLALEVFGSFLFDKRRVEEWEDALQKLKQLHSSHLQDGLKKNFDRCDEQENHLQDLSKKENHLQDVLKISFDGLDEQEKCIFLDIACFFLNLDMKRDDAIDVMKGCGFRAETVLAVLIARSLVKVTEDNTLWMHDQIRDMGRQIVLRENILCPGMRSRLWDDGEILGVLQDGVGTRSIQGIILDFEKNNFLKDKTAKISASKKLRSTPNMASALTYLKEIYKEYFQHGAEKKGELIICAKAFESMVNLRLLQISNVKLEGNFKHLPAELKWLQWRKCPLKCLPADYPRELAVLDLSESKIEIVWACRWWWWYNNKEAKKLMVMNLTGCYNITTIPDLSGHPALEKLILERCCRLSRIHKSVGDLNKLRHLNLRDCSSLVEFPSDVSGLKQLENLILSGCSKLKELPHDMGSMNSLRELLTDGTAIEKLPESIFRLIKLEKLSLNDCQSLRRLPNSVGKLGSLRELSLNGSAVEELPNSIGSLKNLEKLSLMRCVSLTVIPDSVCDLESLTKFWLCGSSVKEMPASIGSLSYLKDLSVGCCCDMGTLPLSIGRLASLVELHLVGTSIIDLPDQIGALKSLQKLEMRNCKFLKLLPETIGSMLSLNTLIIENAAIAELPESIGMLENIVMLSLNKCKLLCRLPASIGKLKSLRHLLMEEIAVTELPGTFGMLSNLLLLKEFNARSWKISGKIPDQFGKLSSLEILNLGDNDFFSLPSCMRGLSNLKELYLPHCKELKFIPPLPSSLVKLNAANCTALEFISDLSNLERLEELHLTNCEKLVDIPGFECLKSLRRLHISGCNLCSSVVKGKLDKVALKNLYNLSMPGSEIPDWFAQEVVCSSKPKNHVIKGVNICVVASVNHQIPDDLRDQPLLLPGVHAKILRLNDPVYDGEIDFAGVPKTHDDQVYLCRYQDYHPLVFKLKDGDKIQLAMENPPSIEGVELKKCGIHLVFENDNDCVFENNNDCVFENNNNCDVDEESLNVS